MMLAVSYAPLSTIAGQNSFQPFPLKIRQQVLFFVLNLLKVMSCCLLKSCFHLYPTLSSDSSGPLHSAVPIPV